MTVEAILVSYNPINDEGQINLGDHKFQSGGVGSGYCYGHQSFDCIDHLSRTEQEAMASPIDRTRAGGSRD